MFEPGNTLGLGRKKGSLNKATSDVRKAFQSLVENNLQQIEQDLKELEPKDRIRMIIELAKFVLPTLKAQDITTNFDLMPKIPIIQFVHTKE